MKKKTDILIIVGLSMIIIGIIIGVVLGYILQSLVVAIPTCLLSFIVGSGFISIAGSLNKVQESEDIDLNTLNSIIEKIKNENQ